MGTAAPAMMPTEDLEAAIAELPAKKDALHEAFDSLAACSPHPLPFTWEDLDAHVSAVQSSISRRFSQLRALEAARPARTSENKERANEVGEEEEEEKVVEEEEEEVEEEVEEVEEEEEEEGEEEEEEEEEEEGEEEEEEEEVEEEEEGEEEEEEEEVEEEEEEADMQMQEADCCMDNEAKDAKEGGEDDKQDADEEEAVTTKVSAGQGKEAEGEELDGYAQWDREEQDTEEEEMVEKMTKKQRRGLTVRSLTAGARKEFAEACERMDAGTLIELLICVSVNKKLLIALHLAPDPAALVLQVVKLFLSSKEFKCSEVWGKCIRLFCWLSKNSVKHSADTTEQAKLVAKDWKEMISGPECCEELDSLARGLLQFLISYNIVSEFSTHEIISIFAMVPRKGHQKKKNHTDDIKLCEDLGLADRVTDLIDYMIGNGQHLEVFHVLQIFNLEDKYPPFSLLKGYIEKAKQTSVELFRKNETHKSLDLDIPKEICIAQQLAQHKLADSSQRSAILAEIRYLIGAYKKDRRSINPSMPSTWDSQHQPTKCKKKNKKRKKEELEHHEAQVNQQQQAQNENKLIQGKQHQLHQQENKAQVTEQQQQQPPRPATLKLSTPAVPLVLNVARIQNFVRPPYAAMPGVHNYLAQLGWPVGQGMPFVPQFRSPQYMGLTFNPFALHPPSYPR